MIMPHEVTGILKGAIQGQWLDIALNHHMFQGFHKHVPEPDRQAFKKWLESNEPLPEQMAMPAHPQQPPELQMELPV